jgi:hypothetical protein
MKEKNMSRVLLFTAAAVLCSPMLARADSPGPVPNPYQEYPPSCVAYPVTLPAQTDPLYQINVNEPTHDNTGAVVGNEAVTFFFWRTPCDNNTSALMGQASRSQSLQGTSPVPEFPSLFVSQGNLQSAVARVNEEPNTQVSFYAAGLPVAFFQNFIFENVFDSSGNPQVVNYSQALTLTIDGNPPATLNIPVYNKSQYTDGSLPMQISGYNTGNYSDPVAGGQGVQIEVAEGTPGQRVIVFAWYTYDPSGVAYWLFNSTTFAPGARSVSLPLGYFSGGTFVAGSGHAALWGNITVTFPDCDHMTVTYQAANGLPSGTPQGAGTRTFTKITSINGVSCN